MDPAAAELHATLSESQRLGFLGARPIDEVVEHARSFVTALDGIDGPVLDLGSGGGVPGLVIALDRPDLSVTLLDRRATRTDFLRRVVARHGWGDRVHVVTADASRWVTEPFDAVVARGFGPPERTLRTALRLLRDEGRVVVSEPPGRPDRWDSGVLADVGVVRRLSPDDRVACFERRY